MNEKSTDTGFSRVTGKQVLNDAIVLAKDTGTFLFDLGRLVVHKIRCAIAESKKKNDAARSNEPGKTATA